MRLSVRVVPWLVALAGLAIPLVGTNFALWQLVAVWVLVLVAVWLVGRVMGPRDRALRVLFGIAFLPMLFLLAWEGGWWLIPADIAWLVVEYRDRTPIPSSIA